MGNPSISRVRSHSVALSVGGWISENFSDGYLAAGVLVKLTRRDKGLYNVSESVPKRKETDHE